MRKDEKKRALWRERIKAYRASGLPAKAWCEQNDVNINLLKGWISTFNRESRESSTSNTLLPVEISEQPTENVTKSKSSGIRINVGSASIELSLNFDHNTLKTVIGILSEQC